MSVKECVDIIEKLYEYEGRLLLSKEWQTLKSAVLAQQTTNTASPFASQIADDIELMCRSNNNFSIEEYSIFEAACRQLRALQ